VELDVELLEHIGVEEVDESIANIAIILDRGGSTLISQGRYRKS
jgi:hypothetical protein